ncbi:MAG: potassium channel family protein, partial [Planctomycetota bacterium]
VLLMFLASLIEVLVWAFVYLWLNAIEGVEQAFYFSMVTFTTLGYGDVVLQERWRLLASFEAANGIILFGWTTAIVMAVVHRVYFQKEK